MEELLSFLSKIHDDFKKNLVAFNDILDRLPDDKKTVSVAQLDDIAFMMQDVSTAINQYKNIILKLEDKYFCDDENQFVLSFQNSIENFGIENNEKLSCTNFYKNSIKSQILKHKYSDILKNKTSKNEPNVSNKNTIILDNIDGVDLQNNYLELPVVKELENIPPAFYWYSGDKLHKSGIYTSLCKNFYVKVPFPNLLNPAKDFNSKSIKCKHETLNDCHSNKKKLASIYGGDVKECFYVHKKEKFNKVGSQYRCNVESFGNHKILDYDLKKVSNFDIKHLLLYSLSDDILAILWYQNRLKNNQKIVFTNLDTY